MGKIWIWDGTRRIKGTDWNVMQEVVENVVSGHTHDGSDSHEPNLPRLVVLSTEVIDKDLVLKNIASIDQILKPKSDSAYDFGTYDLRFKDIYGREIVLSKLSNQRYIWSCWDADELRLITFDGSFWRNPVFTIDKYGTLYLGLLKDVTLYRAGVDLLKTDDDFEAENINYIIGLYQNGVRGVPTDDIRGDAVTVDKLGHNIDATGIGFDADKVDGKHASELGVSPHAPTHVDGGTDEINTALDLGAIPLLPYSKLNFGTWEKIAEVVTASSVSYVDFNSLDINTDKFYVLMLTIVNYYSGDNFYNIYFNGDVIPSNYYDEFLQASGTTVSAGSGNYAYFMEYVPTGKELFVILFITRDPSGYGRWLTLGGYDAPTSRKIRQYTGVTKSTVSNITSIRISANYSSGIGTGSKLLLFKVRTK